MSDRYLTIDGLHRALEQGRTVEQWLGARNEGRFRVLKWLRIERNRKGETILRVQEVLDEGSPTFLDVYEFTPYDAEAEDGLVIPFANAQEALDYSVVNLSATRDKFVREGEIKLEYSDYLRSRGTP